jgi:tetratricopeptide (TPR) repeat protein
MNAIARWEDVLATQPGNELARFSLAKALYDVGRHAEALEHFNVALSKRPDWMVAQILAGRCHLAMGDRPEARKAFERARQLAIDQDHQGPREEMAQLLAGLQ